MGRLCTAALLVLLAACSVGRAAGSKQMRRRRFMETWPDTSVLNFAVSVGSGEDAAVRRAYVAQDLMNGAVYSVAQVEQGAVALGGASLAVGRVDGRPVQSIFVFRLLPGSVGDAKWAVNLQASASAPQNFFLTAAAASPNSGNLFLTGTFSGVLSVGDFNLTSSGSFDIFVAAVSAADGNVLWATSFGGAVGSDAGHALGFNPGTGEVLVAGVFSKNAVFGPDHAAAASVNNVLQAQGVFVACLTAMEGAVRWVSSFPSDAETVSSVRLAVSLDAIFLGAAAVGPFTLYAGASKVSIPGTGAGAVFVKLDFEGQLDANIQPGTLVAVTNGRPDFTLSSLVASPEALFVGCTYMGRLLASGAAAGAATEDGYSNAAVVQMSLGLEPVWWTSLGGSGAQTVESLAVAPGNTSVFASGNAWSPDGVAVTSSAGGGQQVTFAAAPGGSKGAYLLQLAGASGVMVWLRTFEGYQDQASQLVYGFPGGSGTPQVVVTGLFDRGRLCLALNSRDSQCATGVRPFFLAAIPVSPTNTAAVERELEENNPARRWSSSSSSDSGLSAGAVAGIVIGSVFGAAAIAAAAVFLYNKRRQQQMQDSSVHGGGRGGRDMARGYGGGAQLSGPSWASGTTVSIAPGAIGKK